MCSQHQANLSCENWYYLDNLNRIKKYHVDAVAQVMVDVNAAPLWWQFVRESLAIGPIIEQSASRTADAMKETIENDGPASAYRGSHLDYSESPYKQLIHEYTEA